MQRLFFKTLFFTILILFATCDETSQDAEPKPLEFSVEPTEELSFMVDEAPSDFTWEFFEENILITLNTESNWEDELVLSGFQVLNEEVVDRFTSNSFSANSEELQDGLLTGNLFTHPQTWTRPGVAWSTDKIWTQINNSIESKWKNKKFEVPKELWKPGQSWAPSEIEEAVLAETIPVENESLFVVYVQLAEDSPKRTQTTKPFGLLMELDD